MVINNGEECAGPASCLGLGQVTGQPKAFCHHPLPSDRWRSGGQLVGGGHAVREGFPDEE